LTILHKFTQEIRAFSHEKPSSGQLGDANCSSGITYFGQTEPWR